MPRRSVGEFGYKLIGGHLYEDTRAGSRLHILSFCLDDPQQGPVVILPIIGVGAEKRPLDTAPEGV